MMLKVCLFALLALSSSAPTPHHHHQRTFLQGNIGVGLNQGYGTGYGYGSGYNTGYGGYQTGYPGLLRSPVVASAVLGGPMINPLSTGGLIQPTYIQPAIIAQPGMIGSGIGYGNGG